MISAPVLLLGLVSALRVPGPLSPRIASYEIHARLDAPASEIRGTVKLRWRNTGTAPVRQVPLHLYMNAFKNDRSLFFVESRRLPEPIEVDPGRWGHAQVSEVAARGAAGRLGARLVVDATEETVATVALERPVAVGETLELTMAFSTHLPQIISRAGVDHGFYAAAQWFPKIGVYVCDPSCSFRAAAYHADSEFFADFGVYDVTLDLPADLVVGATGVRVDDRVTGDRRVLTYHAEDVHDFVWTADAHLQARAVEIDDGSGLTPVIVHLLSAPTAVAHADRHLVALRAGLRELGRRLGPYPYRELTVVQPPPGAEEAGAMEYPTLFFTEDQPYPREELGPELVTAHELAHQWFQGMLASDEVEEPWLDEGLAELATGWVLARLRPGAPAAMYSMVGHALHYTHWERVQLADERGDAVVTPAYAFRDHRSYAEEVYRKAALLLATIEARLGPGPFETALRAYADRHRFAHPRTADLLAAFAGAPAELRVLLQEGLTRPGALDYAVTAVRSWQDAPAVGLFDADGGVREAAPGASLPRYHSEIVVERLGELRLSQTLRVRFADGEVLDRVLPAEDLDAPRWRRVELDDARAVESASLSPSDDSPLDTHRWNDGLRAKPAAGPRHTLTESARLLAAALLSWVGR